MYLLDTNILILYLAGNNVVKPYIEVRGAAPFISTITVAELLSHPKLSSGKLVEIKDFLSGFKILDFDNNTAYVTASLRRKHKGLKLPDAILAATAKLFNLTLVSRDTVFKNVKEIKVVIP